MIRKPIRRLCRCVIVAFALFILVSAMPVTALAYAASETDPAVRVGYYENEVFQEGARRGAPKTGYAYEYYRKLSEYTGWKYEYVYGGFSELYQMLLDGEIDLLAGLAWREERAALIGYPDAVMGSESYYLVKHGADARFTADPATLRGCSIGVLDSAMVDVLKQYLSERGVTATVVPYPDYSQLFSAFDSNAVDILAAESDGAHGRENAEVLSVFGASDYYLCVSAARPDLLTELNTAQALLAAEEPNYLSSLSARYYSISVTALAFSEAEREWMESHTALRVGYLENYLPFCDTDAKGNVTGAVKDIVPAILEAVGCQAVEVSYRGYQSYDGMIAAINGGEVDVVFPVGGGLYYSEENGIYQSNTVSSSPAELVYKGEFTEKTTEHFAVNQNNRMQHYFVLANYPDAEITFYESSDACLSAVLSGKVGCATMNGLRANDILRNRKYNALSHRQTSYIDVRCFGVEIGDEGLLKLLNRGISILGVEYTQNLLHRYNDGLFSYGFIDVLMDHMALCILVILAVVAFVIAVLVRDTRRTRKEMREKEAARQALEEKNRALAESRQALSDALSAAEAANRAKTAFLNNMSHDIRTPMNAIVGFAALAASRLDDRELVRDYLGKISVSSQHLLSLINDVLDMSRIESGQVTIEEAEVHLPDVIRDLQTILQSDVSAKHLALTVDMRDVIHEDIVTDKLRLSQVLLNILTNAVKFTPPGGAIRFLVTEKPSPSDGHDDFEFRIKDNGIGMSEEFQKKIFDAFTREKTSTVSGIEGTGLGMAITKNLVDLMGGAISVVSEEHKGSEFIVSIPCRVCDVSRPQAPEAEKSAQRALPDFTGKRVLLAEDNELNQMIAEAILTETGLSVEIAGDGAQAVEKMETAPDGYYDIILMDIQMPNMDGYEAAKRIRAMDDRRKAAIPIVAVTANAFEEDRKIAMEAGMNGHLAKPYDIPAIMETLAALLA